MRSRLSGYILSRSMSRTDRVSLIERIEKARGSRVISVFLGDRPGAETRIAPDLIPRMARYLREIGKVHSIDIFLYSTGGEIMSGYRVVSLVREYCKKFSVLVPFRCQSTATLLALGADEIVMSPEGQLSPVDPSINGPYNPLIPGISSFQPGQPLPVLPVSVEEVVSYVKLAKEVGGLKEEAGLASAFERLTADVRPLALGQVYRAREQIRMLSRKLLESHMKESEAKRIEKMVATLTEELYSHDYLISRQEAKLIGLPVIEPASELEQAMVQLFETYAADLSLWDQFNPLFELQKSGAQNSRMTVERAYIETTASGEAFITERTVSVQPDGTLGDVIHNEGWKPL